MREPTSLDKYIMNILNRFAWLRWPAKQAVLNRCKEIIYIGKRKRVFYTCEQCRKNHLSIKEVEVDHTEPRIDPEKGFEGLEMFVLRTFVGTDKLQLLCLDCHHQKSEEENKVRRLQREKDSTGVQTDRRRNKKTVTRKSRKSAKVARRRMV